VIGRTISHYKILEKLGEGGMGAVYRAEDLTLRRNVALKFLPPKEQAGGEARERLLTEARSASVLNHPNICTIHEIGDADGELFIVMEFIEGQSLRHRIGGGPLPTQDAMKFALDVATGLKAAHDKDIVHRDIKPENIIITPAGVAKIADFGLAQEAERGRDHGTVSGTIAYMSPEQLEGGPVDARSDIWSVGIVLYEMLTGQRPFGGDYDEAAMYSIVHEKHRPAISLRRDIPAAIERIIDRCLEKPAAVRYQDAESLIEDLRHAGQAAKEPAANSHKSIAILPFKDISPEQDNKYFSDGLTEEIITNLSRLRNIRIISRASVMQYERTGKTMKQIASDLGVQYLLDGSVRKSGTDLRITTQLIDANQDAYLWAENYNGTMGQIFDFQESVASRIVKALKLRLTPGERKNLKRRPTENTEAYQLYLKGRYFWGKRSQEGIRTAIRYFEEAIGIDPTYALAWAGIADSYNLLGEFGSLPRKEIYSRAKAAASRAVELDSRLAEAHTSLGLLLMLDELDWVNAEKEFKLAIRLNPNYPTAHHWYTEWLLYHGTVDEALREITKAEELDPLSAAIAKDKGLALYYARQYDGAIEQAVKALELDPDFHPARRLLSLAYQGKGMFKEALEENRRWGEKPGYETDALIAEAQLHAASGKRPEALELINKVKPETLTSGNLIRGVGLVYATLGEDDLAFRWFEKGFEFKAESLATLKIDPKVDRLRSDPRFASLVKKVGLGG
jgi:serine/threonine-protein kinase